MMKLALAAGTVAFAATMALASAQTSAAADAMTLSQDQCQAIWNKADSAKAGSITADQAAPYVTDFKTANASGSGQLTSDEFMAACGKGMVHDAANTGSGSGTSGDTAPKTTN